MKLTFDHICNQLAARNCYNSGMSVATIAAQAKVSKSTIYRWLKNTK